MTNQDKKEYLQQYRYVNEEINELLRRRDSIKAMLERVTPAYGATPGGNSGPDKMSSCVSKLIEIERQLDSKIDFYIDFGRNLEIKIDSIKSARHRQILKMRYLDFMNWDDISKQIHLEIRWVYRLHEQALSDLHLTSSDH